MAAILADCPHCNGANMGFSFVAQQSTGTPGQGKWLAFFVCNKCQGGLAAEYQLYDSSRGYSDIESVPGDPDAFGFARQKIYPQATGEIAGTHAKAIGSIFPAGIR